MPDIEKSRFEPRIVESLASPTTIVSRSLPKVHLGVPLLLAAVTLLGGVRFASPAGEFVFIIPSLLSLILSVLSIALFARAGVLSVEHWTKSGSVIGTISHFAILLLLFTATAQTYNAVLPERGVLLWIFGIFMVWNLWTNLLADLAGRRLIVSFVSSIGLAFVVRYLVLANVTATGEGNFIERWWNEPGRQAVTWALDLPKYSDATGYLQFFVVLAMATALYLMPQRPPNFELTRNIEDETAAVALDSDTAQPDVLVERIDRADRRSIDG